MIRFKRTDMANENPPDRMNALADGVFAIVMTLLVLELVVGEMAKSASSQGLFHELLEMGPRFLIYGLSFLILGLFWVMHHMIFQAVIRHDTSLIWLNIFFLMFVSLIPFSTALFGTFVAQKITALIYGVNMLLMFNLGWALWAYATRGHRLVDPELDPALIRNANRMGLFYCLIMLPAVGVSFLHPVLSFLIYGFIVTVFILATALGRADLATLWPMISK